jgi:hypothetical protein
MRAIVADEAERSRLWPLGMDLHPHHAGYRRRMSREIPVVLLVPDEVAEPSRPAPSGAPGTGSG